MVDLVIIGDSAAGMSAAVYSARAGLSFLIISKDKGGNTAKAGLIENYLGFSEIPGMKLIGEFEKHLAKYQPTVILEEVKKLREKDDIFLVKTAKQTLEAKTVIVASGCHHRKLNIPGEDEFFNKGISYCESCDGPLFKDRKVAVIGGGNSAIKAALSLSKIAKSVDIVTIDKELRGERVYLDKIKEANNIRTTYQAKTLDFYGTDNLEGFRFENLETKEKHNLKVDGVFIYIGLIPNTGFIDKNLDVVDKKGAVAVDRLGKTKIAGLFAAGDVTDLPYRQVSIAVSSGAISALSAIDYLMEKN